MSVASTSSQETEKKDKRKGREVEDFVAQQRENYKKFQEHQKKEFEEFLEKQKEELQNYIDNLIKKK